MKFTRRKLLLDISSGKKLTTESEDFKPLGIGGTLKRKAICYLDEVRIDHTKIVGSKRFFYSRQKTVETVFVGLLT